MKITASVWATVAFAIVPTVTFCQTPQPTWGSSQAAVLAAGSAHPHSVAEVDGESVVQREAAEWGGAPARILYIFVNDKLVRSKFIFSTEHPDPTDFLSDYAAIAAQMLKEYGRPSAERAVWENDSLQEEKIAYLQQDRALPSDLLR